MRRLPELKGAQLYRYYDKDVNLLYVGMSSNALRRVKEHQKDKEWYWDIVKITIENFDMHHELVEAEKEAIAKEQPRYNITPYEVKEGKVVWVFDKEKEWGLDNGKRQQSKTDTEQKAVRG